MNRNYAAHIVMQVEIVGSEQKTFPVWENVVLIAARSAEAAIQQAIEIGQADAGDDDGSFRWGGKPARWVFVGVRKVTECVTAAARLGTGDELTYVEYELASRERCRPFCPRRANAGGHE